LAKGEDKENIKLELVMVLEELKEDMITDNEYDTRKAMTNYIKD